jgi:predicted phosphodiesterase
VKLALISDLHGNLEALEAVLRDIDRSSLDARLVCAGDVVGYGPDPEACIGRLQERAALCVMGNHEEMVLGRRDFSRCVHAGIVAAVWTRKQLGPAARAYLEALPPYLRIGSSVVVCHGDLESADTYVSTPERAQAALAQLRADHPECEMLVCGHTHHAALFTPERGFQLIAAASDHRFVRGVINPGSVGQARDGEPLASYAVLDTECGRVSFRQVAYDYETTLRKLREAKLVAQVVLEPPQGVWRRVERYRALWARYWAERR